MNNKLHKAAELAACSKLHWLFTLYLLVAVACVNPADKYGSLYEAAQASDIKAVQAPYNWPM